MSETARTIFGTDGVRGLANQSPMDSETALMLGRAIAAVFKNGQEDHRIVVGKDTRLSGYMLETALASGICSMGADVMLVGPLPTPGIAFIGRSMRADAGAVISASHNPYGDNGIKFFDREGFKLPDQVELALEKLVASGCAELKRPTGEGIGRAHRIEDAAGRYIQFLKGTFPSEFTLDGMRLVVDCANGAGYRVAPAVFEELGAEVIELGTHPDGININDNVGALHPEKMCELVRRMGANAGIALDGDADRVVTCDERGHLVDGDVLMALLALDLKRRGELAGDVLVATVMSNLAIDRALERHGVSVIRTKVGDRHIIEAMRQSGYTLGGEQSGHLIFLNHNTTGDGIVGGLALLACLCREGRPLSELAGLFEPFPQVRLDVPVVQRRDFTEIPEIVRALQEFTAELGTTGRLMLRFSGTENVARILVEGEDSGRVRCMANDLAGLVHAHLGEMPPAVS